MNKKIYTLHCKYCGTQVWEFIPDQDFETMEDILEYDFETLCKQCAVVLYE